MIHEEFIISIIVVVIIFQFKKSNFPLLLMTFLRSTYNIRIYFSLLLTLITIYLGKA